MTENLNKKEGLGNRPKYKLNRNYGFIRRKRIRGLLERMLGWILSIQVEKERIIFPKFY